MASSAGAGNPGFSKPQSSSRQGAPTVSTLLAQTPQGFQSATPSGSYFDSSQNPDGNSRVVI